jgi:hypothetical protein
VGSEVQKRLLTSRCILYVKNFRSYFMICPYNVKKAALDDIKEGEKELELQCSRVLHSLSPHSVAGLVLSVGPYLIPLVLSSLQHCSIR